MSDLFRAMCRKVEREKGEGRERGRDGGRKEVVENKVPMEIRPPKRPTLSTRSDKLTKGPDRSRVIAVDPSFDGLSLVSVQPGNSER